MIDFVKIFVEEYNGSQLKNNALLSFHTVVNEATGERMKSSKALYRGLVFIIFENGSTCIQGSLHKYINEGHHNYDDFTYSRLKDSISQLENLFGIDPRRCKLQNLEVGLNIDPRIKTEDILDNLVLHKVKKFKDVSLPSGNYKQAMHEAYCLKAYDKALQNDIIRRIFRWEIKMMRAEIINKHGVINLHDLQDKRLLKVLLRDLVSKWDETLLVDPTIRYNELSVIDNLKMQSWRNTDHWIRLRKQYSKHRRHKFTKELKEYKYVVENHSDNIQDIITNILSDKCNYCLNN